MSRRHFQALADALRGTKERFNSNDAMLTQWQADVMAIARVCAAENPRFDRARFLAACGMEA